MKKHLEEEKYLKYALNIIKNNIEGYKKNFDNSIEDSKKLSFEDRLRGMHLQLNSNLIFNNDNIARLEKIVNSPYFGRVDFLADKESEKMKIYLGKTNVTDGTISVITDWRTPIANLYYNSDIGRAEYKCQNGIIKGNVDLKRQITIKESKLIDVQDTNLISVDELLKPYLNQNADNKMKIIIASIQKEQNDIIRKEDTTNLIVQGVAGSGKTSVALHRIAYLIYNLGINSSSKFLVLGPNSYFLNYISSILPDLETSPVSQSTLLAFLNDYMNERFKINDKLKIKKVDEKTYKKVEMFKNSIEYKQLLDHFLNDYVDQHVDKDFIIDGEVILSKDEVKQLIINYDDKRNNLSKVFNYLKYRLNNNKEQLYDKLNKKYRDIYIDKNVSEAEKEIAIKKSNELSITIKNDLIKNLKKYISSITIKPIDVYINFIANLSKYNTGLSDKEILLLQKYTLVGLKQRRISFDDIPALMHINHKFEGPNSDYEYINIDEAQDYGYFHFAAIREVFPNAYFSIYGDLAQSVYSYKSVDSWEKVNSLIFNNTAEVLNLKKSYRTTVQITENANEVLDHLNLNPAEPVIRKGVSVEYIDINNYPDYKISKINELLNSDYKSIAVICKNDEEVLKAYDELKFNGIQSKMITSTDTTYNGGLVILTSAAAKGLEFDAVVINDASENKYNEDSDVDKHLLYVASTRALHEEIILYYKNLTNIYSSHKKEVKKLSKSI